MPGLRRQVIWRKSNKEDFQLIKLYSVKSTAKTGIQNIYVSGVAEELHLNDGNFFFFQEYDFEV